MSLLPHLLAWFLRIRSRLFPSKPPAKAKARPGAAMPIILKWNGLFHPLYDSEGKTNLSTRKTRV
jgi:hypothetical protein